MRFWFRFLSGLVCLVLGALGLLVSLAADSVFDVVDVDGYRRVGDRFGGLVDGGLFGGFGFWVGHLDAVYFFGLVFGAVWLLMGGFLLFGLRRFRV